MLVGYTLCERDREGKKCERGEERERKRIGEWCRDEGRGKWGGDKSGKGKERKEDTPLPPTKKVYPSTIFSHAPPPTSESHR